MDEVDYKQINLVVVVIVIVVLIVITSWIDTRKKISRICDNNGVLILITAITIIVIIANRA